MIWRHVIRHYRAFKRHRRFTVRQATSVILEEIDQLRKEIKMDFTQFDAALQKLGADVSAEIAAAVAAINAAQTNPADVQHLADAVAALNNADAVIVAATAQFTPAGTSTDTVPPPPTV